MRIRERDKRDRGIEGAEGRRGGRGELDKYNEEARDQAYLRAPVPVVVNSRVTRTLSLSP